MGSVIRATGESYIYIYIYIQVLITSLTSLILRTRLGPGEVFCTSRAVWLVFRPHCGKTRAFLHSTRQSAANSVRIGGRGRRSVANSVRIGGRGRRSAANSGKIASRGHRSLANSVRIDGPGRRSAANSGKIASRGRRSLANSVRIRRRGAETRHFWHPGLAECNK